MSKENFVEIIRYENRLKNDWDSFLDKAKNRTFLFKRDFIEYHNNKFDDFSLIFYINNQIQALLPANKVENILYSHQGLTYGGLILNDKICENGYFQLYDALKLFLEQKNFSYFVLKQQLSFYNVEVSLWANQYFDKIFKKEMNLTVDLLNLSISKSKLKHYRRSTKRNFEIKKETDLSSFWINVLQPLLWKKYKTKPVHNLKEIQYLKDKFPENIQQYSLYYDGIIIAGITLFIADKVVKSQYGAATDLGKELRAMDYLFIYLLHFYKDLNYHYFDMGTVTNPNYENNINSGLLQQKIELGCEIYDQFTFNLVIT